MIATLPVAAVTVDEGHLVSLWGLDFRKCYSNIYSLRSFLKVPMSIFTATCTPQQMNDIIVKTGIRRHQLERIILSPDR